MSQLQTGGNSFEVIAREWFDKHSANWVASHADRIIRRLERDIFPWIGGTPIAEIAAPKFLDMIRRIEQRGALETVHRTPVRAGRRHPG